jgi:hypothetical protein
MAESIREALTEAWDKHNPEGEDEVKDAEIGGSPEDAPEPVGDSQEAAPESDTPESKPAEDTDAPEPVVEEKSEAKKVEAKTPEVKAPAVKPPQSWTPKAREEWAKIPATAQAEIQKREVEVQRALSQSANARKFGEEFHKVVSPYEGLMRAQGARSPLDAINNLVQTAAGLSLGSAQQKAQIVGNIIRQYGVDLATLDAHLAGSTPPPDTQAGGVPPEFASALDAKLAPVMQFIQQMQGVSATREQQTQAQADQAVENFVQNPEVSEFFEDLREDMADLMETAARRGRHLTLEQAFKQATALHPDIADIISKRAAFKAAKGNATTVASRKAAASSLAPGGPNGIGGGDPKTLRGAISAAVDKHW